MNVKNIMHNLKHPEETKVMESFSLVVNLERMPSRFTAHGSKLLSDACNSRRSKGILNLSKTKHSASILSGVNPTSIRTTDENFDESDAGATAAGIAFFVGVLAFSTAN